jgi:hypothetical protein
MKPKKIIDDYVNSTSEKTSKEILLKISALLNTV